MNTENAILIRTKLNAPTSNHKIIRRTKILKKLQQVTEHKLTLITAPAGFGKTTAAVSYLVESGLPYAWLSLDESDNDPVRFWRYVLAALRGIGNFGKDFWEIPVRWELINSNLQADMILDKLYTLPGTTVMVLDDYHLIHNAIIRDSLAYFIKYLPSHFRIIILSRSEPEFKFSREYAGGQVLKLDVRDLSFDDEEVAAFFQIKGYQLTDAALTAIKDYTEGWAAGLVVTVLSMAEAGDTHLNLRRFSGENRYIDQFLNDEVFSHWSDEVQDFLVQIALLDKFCGPLCQTVTGRADSTTLLKKLAESNSFIFHLDHENKWFRFHHLFGDFLKKHLGQKDSALRRDLYCKAGEWYRENGLIREAIEIFIIAGDYGQAFPLLLDTDFYLSMVQAGEISAWNAWMSKIPEQYYEGEVRACTGYSWALSMENRIPEARIWVERAQSCFDRIKDQLSPAEKAFLAANVIMTKMNLALFEMDLKQLRACLQQADRIEVGRQIVIGEMNPGEASILKTIYGFKGKLNRFDEFGALAAEKLPRLIGNFAAYFIVGSAECQYERNNLQAAYQILVRGMEATIALNNPGAVVPCMLTLARLKRVQGDCEGALRIVAMGRRKVTGPSKAFWNRFFDLFTAELYLDQQEADAAAEWLNIDRIGMFDSLSCSREYEHLVYTRYLNLIGRYDDALLLLNRLNDFTEKEDRLGSRIAVLCQTAIGYHLKGDSANAMTALDLALGLGREDGYVRTFIDQLGPMAELLAKYKNWKKRMGTDARYTYAKNLFRLVQDFIRVFNTKLPVVGEEKPQPGPTVPQLSVREYRVLRLLAAECSNQEIAAELCISVRTVKFHNSQIFAKLGVDNRLKAVKRAWESGLLE